MRSALVAGLLVAALLAGCSDSPAAADDPSDADFTDLDLAASETTGILRGVVVDDAIRPVAGVEIALSGPTPGNTTTTADGLFGFDGLAPGDYFVQASKAGFQSTQQSAQVVAGIADPPIVKVLLAIDPTTAPYVSTLIFEGFIECSGSFVAFGLAVCSTAGLPNDRFIQTYTLDRPPQWVQSEMSWESTQAVSPELDLVFSAPGEGVLLDNYAEQWGPSPLLVTANETLAAERGLGAGEDLMIRVFNQPVEGTESGDPVEGDDCIDRPALGGCTTGVGVTLQQQFTIITNVFYGFTPNDAWLYAADGPHPLPV
jgi:hypothetical protein